jgi:hypothetical protein
MAFSYVRLHASCGFLLSHHIAWSGTHVVSFSLSTLPWSDTTLYVTDFLVSLAEISREPWKDYISECAIDQSRDWRSIVNPYNVAHQIDPSNC